MLLIESIFCSKKYEIIVLEVGKNNMTLTLRSNEGSSCFKNCFKQIFTTSTNYIYD